MIFGIVYFSLSGIISKPLQNLKKKISNVKTTILKPSPMIQLIIKTLAWPPLPPYYTIATTAVHIAPPNTTIGVSPLRHIVLACVGPSDTWDEFALLAP